jgi:hypothetical protein
MRDERSEEEKDVRLQSFDGLISVDYASTSDERLLFR